MLLGQQGRNAGDGHNRETLGSGLYVDVENLHTEGQSLVENLIGNWPDKASSPSRLACKCGRTRSSCGGSGPKAALPAWRWRSTGPSTSACRRPRTPPTSPSPPTPWPIWRCKGSATSWSSATTATSSPSTRHKGRTRHPTNAGRGALSVGGHRPGGVPVGDGQAVLPAREAAPG